ncbi:hypothetical protein GCM10027168_15120 [Streptomyces capparidis]
MTSADTAAGRLRATPADPAAGRAVKAADRAPLRRSRTARDLADPLAVAGAEAEEGPAPLAADAQNRR